MLFRSRGGTFTDIVGRRPDGRLVTLKLLSENPEHYADAATAGIARLMDEHGRAPIAAVKMGTTVATNALLERRGEPTVLAITAGHKDALKIGSQNRPKIFARHIELPEPVYTEVVEIAERVTAEGDILRSLDEADTRIRLQAAFAKGYRALAIVLMHGYRYPDHERRLGAIAAIAQVAPLLGLLGTIIGLIGTFSAFEQGGHYALPGALSGGFWQALLTTAASLMLAIPAHLAHHFLSGRVRAIVRDVEWSGNEIMLYLTTEYRASSGNL